MAVCRVEKAFPYSKDESTLALVTMPFNCLSVSTTAMGYGVSTAKGMMSLTIVAGVVVGNSLTLDSLTTTDSHDTISVYTGLEGDDMARPQRCRKICAEPMFDRFIPEGQENIDNIILTVDEYEVIRLVDHESCTHEECAKHMDIARSTVTEIYVSARKKIADSLINGKRLLIQGGHYRLCDGSSLGCRSEHCGKRRCSL